MDKYKYIVFGLNIYSDFEIPELKASENQTSDVVITLGQNPEHLPIIRKKGVLFEAAEQDFLFKLDTVGSFRVQEGNKITIQPFKGVSPDEIRLFLLGSTMGALLQQRKMYPIHGSAIVYDSAALIISGLSSAGKSSLAAGLSRLGYKVIADDITVIMKGESGLFQAQPGISTLRLWKDILSYFSNEFSQKRIRSNLEKYNVTLNGPVPETPVIIRKFLELEPRNEHGFTLEHINGIQKFETVRNCTYRLQFLDGFNLIQDHFETLADFVKQIDVYKIFRPISPILVKELASFVEEKVIL